MSIMQLQTNPKEVFTWQDICVTLDEKGIFEKQMYPSKEDLKDKLLIIENPMYQSVFIESILTISKIRLNQSN